MNMATQSSGPWAYPALAISVLTSALIPVLGGCQPRDSNADMPRNAHIAPAINPNPTHIVQISGRIPKSLSAKLFVNYLTDAKDPSCFSHPAAQRGGGPNYRQEMLDLIRQGDSFQAQVMIDKYLPGVCNWRFQSVGAAIVKDGNAGDETVVEDIVSSYLYAAKADAQGCDGTGMDDCPQKQNALGVPVIVPCVKFLYDKPMPGMKQDTVPRLFCASESMVKGPYKEGHRLRPGQKTIRVDFYDLESEADPTGK